MYLSCEKCRNVNQQLIHMTIIIAEDKSNQCLPTKLLLPTKIIHIILHSIKQWKLKIHVWGNLSNKYCYLFFLPMTHFSSCILFFCRISSVIWPVSMTVTMVKLISRTKTTNWPYTLLFRYYHSKRRSDHITVMLLNTFTSEEETEIDLEKCMHSTDMSFP